MLALNKTGDATVCCCCCFIVVVDSRRADSKFLVDSSRMFEVSTLTQIQLKLRLLHKPLPLHTDNICEETIEQYPGSKDQQQYNCL